MPPTWIGMIHLQLHSVHHQPQATNALAAICCKHTAQGLFVTTHSLIKAITHCLHPLHQVSFFGLLLDRACGRFIHPICSIFNASHGSIKVTLFQGCLWTMLLEVHTATLLQEFPERVKVRLLEAVESKHIRFPICLTEQPQPTLEPFSPSNAASRVHHCGTRATSPANTVRVGTELACFPGTNHIAASKHGSGKGSTAGRSELV
mmetsp:Transcript_20909/g.34483  ORF Transcript_20909/g.34483 Transcript_20909/m.34483 type:complete len:205 (-) Transcript_20909:3-617(-)